MNEVKKGNIIFDNFSGTREWNVLFLPKNIFKIFIFLRFNNNNKNVSLIYLRSVN